MPHFQLVTKVSRGSSWLGAARGGRGEGRGGRYRFARILLGFTVLCRFLGFQDPLEVKYLEAFVPGLVLHFAGWVLGIDVTEWSNSNQPDLQRVQTPFIC